MGHYRQRHHRRHKKQDSTRYLDRGRFFNVLKSGTLFVNGFKDQSSAHFWDQGKSVNIKEIVRSHELNFYQRDEITDLRSAVSQSAEPVIGIVIPADFDEQVATGSGIQLQAYYAHWTGPDAVSEVANYFEESLSRMTGAVIRIDLENHKVYPPTQGLGYPMMIAFGMVLGVMTVG